MSREILVTGGAGFVGSHTVAALRSAGMAVVVLDDLSTGHRELLPADVPLHVADVRDRAALRSILRAHDIRAVIHFAARSCVEESVREPAAYHRTNFGGSVALVEVLLEHGIDGLIFSSTAAIFGEPQELPIPDHHPCEPRSPYGESKLAVERYLRWRSSRWLRSVSLRYFNAAGAAPEAGLGEWHAPETHLIPLALDAVLGRGPRLTIAGTDHPTPDGTCIRDFVHVRDLARAHVAALDYLDGGGGTIALNLGSERGTSVAEVVAAIGEVTGREVPWRHGPRRPGDPSVLVASSRGARSKLGWVPRSSDIWTIVEDTWKWHRQLHGARGAALAR